MQGPGAVIVSKAQVNDECRPFVQFEQFENADRAEHANDIPVAFGGIRAATPDGGRRPV